MLNWHCGASCSDDGCNCANTIYGDQSQFPCWLSSTSPSKVANSMEVLRNACMTNAHPKPTKNIKKHQRQSIIMLSIQSDLIATTHFATTLC
jgi:hypothetical protein